MRRFDTCTVQNKRDIQKDELDDSLRAASCPKEGLDGTKIITTTINTCFKTKDQKIRMKV